MNTVNEHEASVCALLNMMEGIYSKSSREHLLNTLLDEMTHRYRNLSLEQLRVEMRWNRLSLDK